MTLNKSKCEFKKESITFLGHVIDASGISRDPDKTAAVAKMPQPTTVTDLRRFLRMVNQLSRFTPHVAELTAMTETECQYAQIEKEVLAVTWACKKFANYIVGKRILIETDHKPLVPILNNKDLIML